MGEDGDETDTATDHATFEEFDETELTNEKNQPPIGHGVSPRERNTSMLLESGRYDNSDHGSDTGTRNELDESVSRSGWGGRRRRRRVPRRRRRLSKQAHTNNFYRIDKNYGEGEHYENCKDILYKPSGYGHMGGYTYAKVVFWEERDCKKGRKEYEIGSNHAPSANSPDHHPDVTKSQTSSDLNNKVSSFGISMNNDILFDGLSDRDGLSRQKDKDGTPWWNGNPATSNRRTHWPTNRRRETEIPLFHHEEQTFCVTFYDHHDMNSFNTETDEEDRPGRS